MVAELQQGVDLIELPDDPIADEQRGGGAALLPERVEGAIRKTEVEQAGAAMPIECGVVEHRQPAAVGVDRGPAEFVVGLVEQPQAQCSLAESGMRASTDGHGEGDQRGTTATPCPPQCSVRAFDSQCRPTAARGDERQVGTEDVSGQRHVLRSIRPTSGLAEQVLRLGRTSGVERHPARELVRLTDQRLQCLPRRHGELTGDQLRGARVLDQCADVDGRPHCVIAGAGVVEQRTQRRRRSFRSQQNAWTTRCPGHVVEKLVTPLLQQPLRREDAVEADDEIRLGPPFRLLDLTEEVAADVNQLAEPGQRESPPLS